LAIAAGDQTLHGQEPALVARYALSNVEENGDEVILTFTLGLRNDSDAQLLNTRLTLEAPDVPEEADDLLPESVFARFEPFDLAAREGVRISHRFVLPAYEYQRWQQGFAPLMRIAFDVDGDGTSHRSTLLLVEVAEVPAHPRAF
jgi:hypothetical protein